MWRWPWILPVKSQPRLEQRRKKKSFTETSSRLISCSAVTKTIAFESKSLISVWQERHQFRNLIRHFPRQAPSRELQYSRALSTVRQRSRYSFGYLFFGRNSLADAHG